MVLVYFHGGGWTIGSTFGSHDPICSTTAMEQGIVVISVDYRMGPEFPYPHAPRDCVSATRWVAGEGRSLWGGESGGLIGVGGDSAGGNLAAVVAHELKSDAIVDFQVGCRGDAWQS